MNLSTKARVGALAVALAASGAGAVALAVPAAAATGCQVTYTTNDWTSSPGQGGFTANLDVKNLGDPINGWTLRFSFPGTQMLTQGWSANWSQSGGTVTATNMSWNASLGTGASAQIGFNANWTGSNPKPATFMLNGVTCTGSTTTPPPTTPPPTTPPPTTPPPTTPPPTSPPPTSPPPAGNAPALHVSGNKILTAAGATYKLYGVNRSGGEFACIQGNGIWDGPMDQASVSAMRTWKVRAVRVPLNEQCWLGVSPVQAQFGGTTYQNAVKAYVNLLISNGITPIVEMHLGKVVAVRDGVAFPDTLVGTDSHTTMIDGLGILGWGVGGIEAEAAMLGQPMFLPPPIVLGVRVTGELPPGTTATDLVLTLTQMLRAHGVVGSFVEFFGDGLSGLSVADRATLSNMCPEYGATAAYFPIDAETLAYLSFTGRGRLVDLVDRYAKEQDLFRSDGTTDPRFSEVLELDLSGVEPSVAGPKRPQDRVPLANVWGSFVEAFRDRLEPDPEPTDVGRLIAEGGVPAPVVDTDQRVEPGREEPVPISADGEVRHGSVVIAAITSCTNTSNPSVMLAAGLLAKKAVEAGLDAKPWVKTSLAPGSRVVTDYLDAAGLTPYLEKLGFGLVGYGCTTCIGNSGPLPDEVAEAVQEHDLAVVAVLSGNRNFEGRIHPLVRASYLASPPLVVAYAIAGTVDADLAAQPLGTGANGSPVYLRELWPSPEEVRRAVADAVRAEQFEHEYGRIFEGDERWRELPTPTGPTYSWDPASTYVREPPFFTDLSPELPEPGDLEGMRCLVFVGDSITTDHISPAGSIKADLPAGRYLVEHGVEPRDFNSYGARRGNHEVMLRGTFANVRLRNRLAPGTEGPWTTHLPDGQVTTIYEAALRYRDEGVPLLVLAGKEYGSGSSRDWAAKGPALLGVRAVLAESFERIHRSNLVGMGVLPLQFADGDSAAALGLSGAETFRVEGLSGGVTPRQRVQVTATRDDGSAMTFEATVRIDGPAEVDYHRHGGILQMVLRSMLRG